MVQPSIFFRVSPIVRTSSRMWSRPWRLGDVRACVAVALTRHYLCMCVCLCLHWCTARNAFRVSDGYLPDCTRAPDQGRCRFAYCCKSRPPTGHVIAGGFVCCGAPFCCRRRWVGWFALPRQTYTCFPIRHRQWNESQEVRCRKRTSMQVLKHNLEREAVPGVARFT